ncbi:unnamed protein product [Brachionus calyciflorus]|uniref:SDE2-like domain-containing protein n=1 Tax=Brachionus calyciflorus TaxID=104777 RepID=A0A814CXU7_9BILA|nr:unnamed protein product [Brachionus calyciflorus]
MELKLKFANSDSSNFLSIFVDKREFYYNICQEIGRKYGIKESDFILISKSGLKLSSSSSLNDGDIVQICPSVLGGKGGFGSLLRAFGKQITKSTNKEACRDLTGRRIRHVNNEKKLKDFLKKQSEVSKKKEEDKKAKLERKRKKKENFESKHHLFVDPKYDEQKLKISEDLDEAMSIAISNKKYETSKNISKTLSSESESSNFKNHAISSNSRENKTQDQSQTGACTQAQLNGQIIKKQDKFKSWLGVDDLDVSSSSDEEDQPVKKIKI